MPGTNAAAVKKALFERLAQDFSARPDTREVQVAYRPPGRIERESVYLGPARFTHETAGMGRDLGGGLPREETLTVTVHLYAREKGGDLADTDTRVVELGTIVEELLATDPTLTGAPGVMFAAVTSGELDGGGDDDAVISTLDYELTFTSTLY